VESYVWSVGSGVRNSTWKCLVQALFYKVVLGSALCKICRTQSSNTGNSSVQDLQCKVLL